MWYKGSKIRHWNPAEYVDDLNYRLIIRKITLFFSTQSGLSDTCKTVPLQRIKNGGYLVIDNCGINGGIALKEYLEHVSSYWPYQTCMCQGYIKIVW